MKNSKWPPFLAGQKFFENWVTYFKLAELPCGSKYFVKIALSGMVVEIQAFLCFVLLKKNWKIQNGRHFWHMKYLLKLGKASRHRYPVGQIFCRNRSISHGFRNTSIFVFCIFEKKSIVENGHHFWRMKYLLKLGKASLHRYPVGQKFAQIPLVNFYLMKKMVSKSTHVSLYHLVLFYMCTL